MKRHRRPDTAGQHRQNRLLVDTRGLSTPVTHALTLGITALLLIMLVGAANGFLADQEKNAARESANTIGNRLAEDLGDVGQLANSTGEATKYVNQPATIVGSKYRAELKDGDTCDTPSFHTDQCIVVSVIDPDVTQKFPVTLPDELATESVERADSDTFKLSAKRSSGTNGNVPIPRLMRIGVGEGIDGNEYGKVFDPTNLPPIPEFSIDPEFPHSGAALELDASESRDKDGTIASYDWYVDGALEASGETATVGPLDPGEHNITLKLEDDDGATSNSSRIISVSGVAYNGDLRAADNDEERCNQGKEAQFSLTNQWSNPITITHVLMDPEPQTVDKIQPPNPGPVLAFNRYDGSDPDWNIEYYTGEIDLDNKDDGEIIRLRNYGTALSLNPGETLNVSICKINGGGFGSGGDPTTSDNKFGFRYWNDGVTNRTIVASDPS